MRPPFSGITSTRPSSARALAHRTRGRKRRRIHCLGLRVGLCPEAWHRRHHPPHSRVTIHQPWGWGSFPARAGPSVPCRAVNMPRAQSLHLSFMLLSRTSAFWSGWASCNSAEIQAFSHKPWRRRISLKFCWRPPCASFRLLPLRNTYEPFAFFWPSFRSAQEASPSLALHTCPISSRVVRPPCRKIGRR